MSSLQIARRLIIAYREHLGLRFFLFAISHSFCFILACVFCGVSFGKGLRRMACHYFYRACVVFESFYFPLIIVVRVVAIFVFLDSG